MGVYVVPGFVAEYIPARKTSPFQSDGWWLNRWPFLGWLETFLKMFAWFFALRVPLDTARVPKGHHILEEWLLSILAGLLVCAVGDRIFYREVISMLFIFPQMGSAVLVAKSMLRGRSTVSVRDFRTYCALQFLGDLTKLVFFVVHDFRIKKVAKWILYTLQTSFFIAYGVILYIEFVQLGPELYFHRSLT